MFEPFIIIIINIHIYPFQQPFFSQQGNGVIHKFTMTNHLDHKVAMLVRSKLPVAPSATIHPRRHRSKKRKRESPSSSTEITKSQSQEPPSKKKRTNPTVSKYTDHGSDHDSIQDDKHSPKSIEEEETTPLPIYDVNAANDLFLKHMTQEKDIQSAQEDLNLWTEHSLQQKIQSSQNDLEAEGHALRYSYLRQQYAKIYQTPYGQTPSIESMEQLIFTERRKGSSHHCQEFSCKQHSFQPGQRFSTNASGVLGLDGGEASGNVYLCTTSGMIHFCTDDLCDMGSASERNERLVCTISGRIIDNIYAVRNENKTYQYSTATTFLSQDPLSINAYNRENGEFLSHDRDEGLLYSTESRLSFQQQRKRGGGATEGDTTTTEGGQSERIMHLARRKVSQEATPRRKRTNFKSCPTKHLTKRNEGPDSDRKLRHRFRTTMDQVHQVVESFLYPENFREIILKICSRAHTKATEKIITAINTGNYIHVGNLMGIYASCAATPIISCLNVYQNSRVKNHHFLSYISQCIFHLRILICRSFPAQNAENHKLGFVPTVIPLLYLLRDGLSINICVELSTGKFVHLVPNKSECPFLSSVSDSSSSSSSSDTTQKPRCEHRIIRFIPRHPCLSSYLLKECDAIHINPCSGGGGGPTTTTKPRGLQSPSEFLSPSSNHNSKESNSTTTPSISYHKNNIKSDRKQNNNRKERRVLYLKKELHKCYLSIVTSGTIGAGYADICRYALGHVMELDPLYCQEIEHNELIVPK